MMRIILILLVTCFYTQAQDINVEYDKNRDLSKYKTFRLGESEIITPKDQQRMSEGALKKLVKEAIAEELKEKGLQLVDSTTEADLVVSFVAGTQDRSDLEQLGPLGMAPGNSSQTWSRDFSMGSLIIDLNDQRNNLIWRINATTTASTTDARSMIDEVVSAGFKKFSLKPKKVKKK